MAEDRVGTGAGTDGANVTTTATRSRQGRKEGVVRYVLAASLVLVVLAMIVAFLVV